jgi:hypothetical protein
VRRTHGDAGSEECLSYASGGDAVTGRQLDRRASCAVKTGCLYDVNFPPLHTRILDRPADIQIRCQILTDKRPGLDYAVEYAIEADHRQVAEVLHAASAAVLISGYPSRLYEELYASWYRVEQTVLQPTSTTS